MLCKQSDGVLIDREEFLGFRSLTRSVFYSLTKRVIKTPLYGQVCRSEVHGVALTESGRERTTSCMTIYIIMLAALVSVGQRVPLWIHCRPAQTSIIIIPDASTRHTLVFVSIKWCTRVNLKLRITVVIFSDHVYVLYLCMSDYLL